MGVKVTGNTNLMREVERRLGKENVERISDKALIAGAEVFVKALKSQFESFKDTGASIEEITIGQPKTVGGARTVPVYWKGRNNRFRIIHLNEFGTVNNPNPAGKGAIARALRNAEKEYRDVIKKELKAIARG